MHTWCEAYYCAPGYITCFSAARLTAVLPTPVLSIAVAISTSSMYCETARKPQNSEHNIKTMQTHKATHVVCTLHICMHSQTPHYYRGGVSLSTWWRGKPSGASDLSNHQGRHRPEVRPLGATGSQLCSVGCLGENKQWQPLIHKFTVQADWPVKHAYPTPHGIHFSVSFSPQSNPTPQYSPPIPPKPLTNCEPSCDLSVIISNVAPKLL